MYCQGCAFNVRINKAMSVGPIECTAGVRNSCIKCVHAGS